MLALSIFKPIKTLAWGKEGHHMVIEIAYRFLSIGAREKLVNYLQGMSIDEASVWMDVEKNNPQYKYLKHTHYIDINSGDSFDPNLRDNLYFELTKVMQDLNTQANQSRVTLDLLILIHLVGDLHQPLHIGYSTDRGGNTIPISINGKSMNLHEAWDSGIINETHITIDDIFQLYSTTPKTQIDSIEKGNIQDWLMDTRSQLKFVYAFNGIGLDEKYVNNASVIIKTQILKAGLRLSVLLEKYLDKLSNPSQSNSLIAKRPSKAGNEPSMVDDKMNDSSLLELYIIGGVIIILLAMGFYYYFKK